MQKEKVISERVIQKDANLIHALKQMDAIDKKLLLVMDGDIFVGLLSVGDIQRSIIQNLELTTTVTEILRKNIKIATPKDKLEDIKKMMIAFRMEFCPVVNAEGTLEEVYLWEDMFGEEKNEVTDRFKLPVVIMAGGQGSRLKPITNVLPKPLMPLDDKTMLEEIFARFNTYGCDQFFVSVNYKADLIEYYINSLNLPLNISFFRETSPLGTAGSLSLLKGKITSTFFVSNCDIIIEQDYSEVLKFHEEGGFEVTIVGAIKHYSIPYGTLETGENGQLLKLREKPDHTILTNSGMYILEPHLIDEIPSEQLFHITHLIDNVMQRGGKVGVFPVSEKSWKDMGVWDEFLKNKVS